MNNFQILGNIVKDPEVRGGNGNGSFTTFSVAVNDGFGDKKKVYFLECAAGGKTGENIAKFFKKGKQGIFEGKLYTAKNKQSGFNEIRLSVFRFHFTSDGGGGNGGNGGGGSNGYNNNNGGGNGNNQNNGGNNNNNNGGNGGYNNNNNGGQGNTGGQNQGDSQGGGYGGSQQGPVDDIPF
jgi:single-stranded DNA-binding protein